MSMMATIAVNRFGLGARPGDVARIASDPRGWLLAQLAPERQLPQQMAALPSTVEDLAEFQRWLRDLAAKGRAQGLNMYEGLQGAQAPHGAAMPGGAPAAMASPGSGLSVESEFQRRFAPRYATALKARFDAAVETERPFFERLVHFWSNHFVVSGVKPASVALPPSFERDAIRPHVTGRFADMLLASTKHPAMLVYLDNFNSIGPNSVVGKNPALRRQNGPQDFALPQSAGLNENLAREIFELHTLGVRGGYSQADVTSFAKVITGWTLARPPRVRPMRLVAEGRLNAQGMFEFDDETHEPGAHDVLGRTYAQVGVDQGEAVLNELARHPSTARFIALKLARHFISDDPPAAAVEKLAEVFRATDGDLRQVCEAMIALPAAWDRPLQKFKTPEEYLVSAARGVPGLRIGAGRLVRDMVALGQRPYRAPGPNGWPDSESEWLAPDAVWKRFEWASEAAQAVASTVLNPERLAGDILGSALSGATLEAIRRADSPVQGLTLLLASAEFQRR